MINYFDLGANKGKTIAMMVDILEQLPVMDYNVYAFEPCKTLYDELFERFKMDTNIHLYPYAIGQKTGRAELFHCKTNSVGHSLFDSKNNISKDDKERVTTIIFSKFIDGVVSTFREDFNILKSNIEGAEWYLFHDLIENGLIKHFPVICGHNDENNHPVDIEKIGEFEGMLDYWHNLMECNNITVHRFTDHRIERNADMAELIKKSAGL